MIFSDFPSCSGRDNPNKEIVHNLEEDAAALPGDDAEAAAVHVEEAGQLVVQTHAEALAHHHLGQGLGHRVTTLIPPATLLRMTCRRTS